MPWRKSGPTRRRHRLSGQMSQSWRRNACRRSCILGPIPHRRGLPHIQQLHSARLSASLCGSSAQGRMRRALAIMRARSCRRRARFMLLSIVPLQARCPGAYRPTVGGASGAIVAWEWGCRLLSCRQDSGWTRWRHAAASGAARTAPEGWEGRGQHKVAASRRRRRALRLRSSSARTSSIRPRSPESRACSAR